MVVWTHVLSGAFAAHAAVLWASNLGSAAPETGDNWLIIYYTNSFLGLLILLAIAVDRVRELYSDKKR